MRKLLSLAGGAIATGCSAILAHPDAAQTIVTAIGGKTGAFVGAVVGVCLAIHGDSPFKSAK